MKKRSAFIVLGIIACIFFLFGTINRQEAGVSSGFYSDSVKMVIDKKCYGCHSIKGKSDDAKDALMWDSLPGLDKGKMVSTLDDMIDVLDKGKMPPEEMVKKYPQAKLLPSEKDILMNWAVAKADSLLE